MRVMLGVTAYGHGKDYILPDFFMMLRECVDRSQYFADVYVGADLPSNCPSWATHVQGSTDLMYADDMLAESRMRFLQIAADMGYDALMWHGVDAMYQDAEDFNRLIKSVETSEPRVVAPLISARTFSNYAVARRFDRVPHFNLMTHNSEGEYLESQHDIPKDELEAGGMVRSGFPGADNMIIDHTYFNIGVPNFIPWYERVYRGLENLCFEEQWVLQVLKRGGNVYVNADVNVWHVDHDGTARLFPDREETLDEIAWWRK